MTIQIAPFDSDHVHAAAELFCSRYTSQRELVPCLPEKYAHPEAIVPRLQEMSGQHTGVVATQDGRLLGFMLAQVLPSFRGCRTAYSPEWANGATPDQQYDVHRKMYADLSKSWVADGCSTHLITTLACEKNVLDAYFWSGFGLAATDALRDLSPIECSSESFDIHLADRADADEVKALADNLLSYMSIPPVLMHHSSSPSLDEVSSQIDNGQHPTWLACSNGQAIASLGLRPACHAFKDNVSISILRAFAREHARSAGIGTALLANAIEWARSNGFAKCAVDFEPENVNGSRFWLRHFSPICQTVMRRVELPKTEKK